MRYLLTLAFAPALAACVEPTPEEIEYTPPAASGLVGVRPYPGPADVCKVIGENDRTREFLDDSATLVGCPVGETGAIRDRQRERGKIVDTVGAWVLISIPDA